MCLFFDMRVSTSLISLHQCPLMPYILQAVCMYGKTFRQILTFNTWDAAKSIQKNGATVSNNGNLTQLQITNQYVLPIMLSILLLL
jgi:hypothetical protein